MTAPPNQYFFVTSTFSRVPPKKASAQEHAQIRMTAFVCHCMARLLRLEHHVTHVRAPGVALHDVALQGSQHMSRGCYIRGVVPHHPKGHVAPVALRGVLQVKLSQRCCDTRGCSSYPCECRATMCNQGLESSVIGFNIPKTSLDLHGTPSC